MGGGERFARVSIMTAVVVIMLGGLTLDRLDRYVADVRSREPRFLTKEDVTCDAEHGAIKIRKGNYSNPFLANDAVLFCPDMIPTTTVTRATEGEN